MENLAALDRCIPAQDVIAKLASEHSRRSPTLTFLACEAAAISSLLPRLCSGVLDAWAVNCHIDSSIEVGPISATEIVSPWDYYAHEGEARKVPTQFWAHFANAGEVFRAFDALTGDCTFSYMDSKYSSREGRAISVHFDHRGLPALSIPYQQPQIPNESEGAPEASSSAQSGKGRKPANWWPDFAEELALYALECGMPSGVDAQGQSEVIDEVFSRMAVARKSEPTRSTVQPVVSALLRRWRSAGKT